jgi:pyruvate kinase
MLARTSSFHLDQQKRRQKRSTAPWRVHSKSRLAVTPSDILGRLELNWGVHAFKKDIPSSTSALFSIARDLVRELGIARSGDLIVVTGGIPLGRSGSTNLLKVETMT